MQRLPLQRAEQTTAEGVNRMTARQVRLLRQENMVLWDANRRLRITIDFLNGRTFLGLARKYGITTKEVEQIVREMTKR